MPQDKVVVVEEKGPGCFGQGVAMLGILASAFWLLNFTFGIVEIPDNLPLVGNLDEAAAAAMLFSCLRYLGIDILPFGRRKEIVRREVIDVTPAKEEKQ
ncbi:MAG: hypothetical protein FJY92_06730 [Candidatus Hydrogenedentes bacterium]|nr:hypothetical protein [Candidatus Hydrogenedentota bacterium]